MVRRYLSLLAAGCIVSYFLYFAVAGLRAGFTDDDLMNIYGSWRHPLGQHLCDTALFFRFSPTYRPVGSLFYYLLFEGFGLRPLPYRIACYALLLANLWLAYALIRRLANSRRIAALAVLLHAYHGNFWALYTNSGLCYDLLCFFFYTAGFLYYLRAREWGLPLHWRPLAIWSSLYILCLNSKEMAVTLPVMIAVYELLVSPPRLQGFGSWVRKQGQVPMVGGVLAAVFIFGRILAKEGLPSMGAYRPKVRLSVFLDRDWHFLAYALYEPRWLTPLVAGALLLLIVAAGVWSRSLVLRFGLAWMLVGTLPVAFIAQRGLDAAYIPSLALALYLAVGITWLAERISWLRFEPLFGAALLALILVHYSYGRFDLEERTPQARPIQTLCEQLRYWGQHQLPKGSRILLLRNPVPNSEWSANYAFYLSFADDPRLQVHRLDQLMAYTDHRAEFDFDVVFSYEDDRLLECDAGPFRHGSIAGLAAGMPSARCWPSRIR